MSLGLVLGAGGTTGAAFHRGVLLALQEVRGLDPRSASLVVGTSAGSLVAARLRSPAGSAAPRARMEPRPVVAPPGSRWPVLTPWLAAARHPRAARVGVLAASLLPAGTRSTEPFVAGVRRQYGTGWPADPTYVVAVRRRDGARVVFGRGCFPSGGMASAVAASCAIPGWFTPAEVDGESYVDGGAWSPTSADLVAGHPLDLVVVSSPMSVDPHGLRVTPDLLLRLAWHRMLAREVRGVRAAGAPEVVVVEPDGDVLRELGTNALSEANAPAIEAAARALAVRRLSR